MTTFSSSYDVSTPQGADDPVEGDDRIREAKAATQERENVDHYWPLTGTEVSDKDAGEHRKVTLRVGSAPTAVANKGFVYAKDVAGKAELFYRDEDGNEVQITTGGSIVTGDFPGKMVAYGGSSAPSGWVLCDGAAYSRTETYDALFAVIGIAYGNGDESTTFNVPDMRGRVPVGLDAGNVNLAVADALGETGGEESNTLTVTEMPLHGHPFRVATEGSINDVAGGLALDLSGNSNQEAFNGTPSQTLGEQIGGEGEDGAHNNLQPFNTANWIIKI